MWQLAVLVTVAVAVIAAVASWSLRGAQDPGREPESAQPGRRPAPSSRPLVPSSRPFVPGQRAVPDGRLLRQGDDVAKSRGRFGITERVGWLRRTDVDEEMWPAEAFGGVSDEQFWDDLSSDKPLATKARTAQPDGDSRRIPVTRRPAAQPAQPPQPVRSAQPARQAAAAPLASTPHHAPVAHATTAQSPAVSQASTAAFPAVGAPSASTAAFPALSSPSASGVSAQSAVSATRPAATARPAAAVSSRTDTYAQPILPRPTAPSGPLQQVASTGSYQAQAASPPRQWSEEDPLTSDAYSLRSADDGRSYRSSRQGSYPATGDFAAATGYPASSGGHESQRDYSGGYSTGGYSTGGPSTGGYSTGTHTAAGYGSGAYPTAPAGGRHSTGGYRRDAYESADTYPAGDGYRGHRNDRDSVAHPYGASATTGAPTPPYGERYSQPAARDYGSRNSGSNDGGYPAAGYGGRDQAARDGRTPYPGPADRRGADPRGGVRY